MTTSERIDLLARAYPHLFSRMELTRLIRGQLGRVDALETWMRHDGARVRARAPKLIYHICAGNLAVSARTSLAHGLLLGAHNVMKLPGDREDSSVRREILAFIRGLPLPLRRLVETHRSLNEDCLHRADVIIAFGTSDTMTDLRTRTRWDQKFITHGPALSLLWLAAPNRLTPRQARACAVDILTYDQLGCLSPQAIYMPPGTDFNALGRKLAHALEVHWQALKKKPKRSLFVASRIVEARDIAHALGHRVWLPPKNHLGWSLIHDPDPTFRLSPLHGVITMHEASESKLAASLASLMGSISTVGTAGDLSSRLENVFLSLGVSRFCAAGRMQFPSLTWHHDGRPSLSDLVTWIDFEGHA